MQSMWNNMGYNAHQMPSYDRILRLCIMRQAYGSGRFQLEQFYEP